MQTQATTITDTSGTMTITMIPSSSHLDRLQELFNWLISICQKGEILIVLLLCLWLLLHSFAFALRDFNTVRLVHWILLCQEQGVMGHRWERLIYRRVRGRRRTFDQHFLFHHHHLNIMVYLNPWRRCNGLLQMEGQHQRDTWAQVRSRDRTLGPAALWARWNRYPCKVPSEVGLLDLLGGSGLLGLLLGQTSGWTQLCQQACHLFSVLGSGILREGGDDHIGDEPPHQIRSYTLLFSLFLHFPYVADPPLRTSAPTRPRSRSHDNRTRSIWPISLIWWTYDLRFTCIYFYS